MEQTFIISTTVWSNGKSLKSSYDRSTIQFISTSLWSKERSSRMKGVRRQRTLHQEHYSINQYITLAKWKELIMKGVRRQRNTGFRLALINSRMILMMILSHHYQHQSGRALRPKNGGEHRKSSYDSFPEECQKRGTTCTRSTIQLISTSRWSNGKSLS